MLKRSLLTLAVLGAFVAAAGAHSEVEQTKDYQTTPELELVFASPPATCGGDAAKAPTEAWFESLAGQQGASRGEEAGDPLLYARGWGGGSSYCIICNDWMCWYVRC